MSYMMAALNSANKILNTDLHRNTIRGSGDYSKTSVFSQKHGSKNIGLW